MLVFRCVAVLALAIAELDRLAGVEAVARDNHTRAVTDTTVVLIAVELIDLVALARARVAANLIHFIPLFHSEDSNEFSWKTSGKSIVQHM